MKIAVSESVIYDNFDSCYQFGSNKYICNYFIDARLDCIAAI